MKQLTNLWTVTSFEVANLEMKVCSIKAGESVDSNTGCRKAVHHNKLALQVMCWNSSCALHKNEQHERPKSKQKQLVQPEISYNLWSSSLKFSVSLGRWGDQKTKNKNKTNKKKPTQVSALTLENLTHFDWIHTLILIMFVFGEHWHPKRTNQFIWRTQRDEQGVK